MTKANNNWSAVNQQLWLCEEGCSPSLLVLTPAHWDGDVAMTTDGVDGKSRICACVQLASLNAKRSLNGVVSQTHVHVPRKLWLQVAAWKGWFSPSLAPVHRGRGLGSLRPVLGHKQTIPSLWCPTANGGLTSHQTTDLDMKHDQH